MPGSDPGRGQKRRARGDSRPERTEEEAGRLLRPNPYFEPFALRALGVEREDERLAENARDRFAGLGLAWHASQTATLFEDG